jgi:molybdate transport system regulatory protein
LWYILHMKIYIKLSVLNDQGLPFMGKGADQLLQGIKRLGSINQAAKEMGLSYAKALKIIKKMEASLGDKVLKTKTGGKEYGGAELTPLATELLDIFMDYEEEVSAFAHKQFTKINDRLNALVKKQGE